MSSDRYLSSAGGSEMRCSRSRPSGRCRSASVRPAALLALLIALTLQAGLSADQAWRKRGVAAGLTVAHNPLNPGTLFAEGTGGTIIVSYDRGGSWNPWSNPGLIAIRQILVHPADTNIVLCAAGSGGLRRTTDYGATWSTVLPDFSIDGESISVYPSNSDTVYAGNFPDGVLHLSTDRGATWSMKGVSSNRLCALAVKPDDPLLLCAGTGGGTISRTTDGGVSWSIVKPGTAGGNFQEVPFIAFHPLNPLLAYATTYGAVESTLDVWKSTDAGATWTRTALREFGTWALALDPTDENVVYAGSFSGILSTVYRSTDGGGSWTSLSTGLPPGSYMWSIKIHPDEPSHVSLAATTGFFGQLGIFRLLTADGVIRGALVDAEAGDTVRNGVVRNPATGDESQITTVEPLFSFGYYEGDPSTTPELTASAWPFRTRAFTASFVTGLTVDTTVPMTRLGKAVVSGVVTDSLSASPIGAGLSLVGRRSVGDTLYTATADGSGAFLFDSLFVGEPGVNGYDSLVVDPEIPASGIVVSPVTITGDTALDVRLSRADVFIVSPFDDGTYAGYYEAALAAGNIRSAKWNVLRRGPAPMTRTSEFGRRILVYYTGDHADTMPRADLDSLAAVLSSGSHLLLMGQNVVERNGDESLFADLLRVGFAANTPLAFNRAVPGEILAGLEFFTTGPGVIPQTSRDVLTPLDSATRGILDYGANTGGTAAVRRGQLFDSSRAVVAGFGLEGVYTLQKRADLIGRLVGYLEGSIVTGVGGASGAAVPVKFRIVGSYPNPFNPSTSIVIDNPSRQKITVEVFDVLGRSVAVIFEGYGEPGRVAVPWEASGHPGGVYFYRVSAPGVALTGKMLLLR